MASTGTSVPVSQIVTPDDHSALVTIAVYFLMITFIIAVIIRFVIRYWLAKVISIDDWVSFGSLVIGIIQSAIVAAGVHHGLGKKESLLDSSSVIAVEKDLYASDIFYQLALGLAKISVLLLLHRLCVQKIHQKVAFGGIIVAGVWTFASIVALAARCGSHTPWSTTSPTTQCVNLHTLFIGLLPVDILTELLTIVLPTLMMIPVHVPTSKKLTIIFAFAFRVLVIGASIARVVLLSPDYIPSDNFTFRWVTPQILTQLVLSISITTACIPCLKPFLDAFDSGRMAVTFRNGVPGQTGSHSYSGKNSYNMHKLAYGNKLARSYGAQSHIEAGMNTSNNDRDHDFDLDTKQFPSSSATEVRNGSLSDHGKSGREIGADGSEKDMIDRFDTNSVASDSKSDQMIIRKETAFKVHYEERSDDQIGELGFGGRRSRNRSQQFREQEERQHRRDDLGRGGEGGGSLSDATYHQRRISQGV